MTQALYAVVEYVATLAAGIVCGRVGWKSGGTKNVPPNIEGHPKLDAPEELDYQFPSRFQTGARDGNPISWITSSHHAPR